MMKFIQREMLRPDVMERLTAHQLRTRFEEAIGSSLSPLLSSIHRMPSGNAKLPRRTSSSYNYHTIVAGVGAAANGNPQRSVMETSEPSVSGDKITYRTYPQLGLILQAQWHFIENHCSCHPRHWADVKSTADALTYILKVLTQMASRFT